MIETEAVLKAAGYFIYAAMAGAALYGVFCIVLVFRRINQKRFRSEALAGEFLDETAEYLRQGDFDGVAELCDSPQYWSKAIPQLALVAVAHRDRGPSKLRRLVGERFEREILADIDYSTSWIGTIVKAAPMLGLLGTVIGMIMAFAKIASAGATGTDPKTLANDISFALITTALGLTIAIPLVMASNVINIRVGKLQDATQEHLNEFLDNLAEAPVSSGGRAAS